jgi:putative sigma-54 modulation protein
MNLQFTAQRFKAHDGLKEYALSQVSTLDKYYDGIVKGNVILRFERSRDSIKIAEINLSVFGTNLVAIEKSEDFYKSIDSAVNKLERQLLKYKGKRRNI